MSSSVLSKMVYLKFSLVLSDLRYNLKFTYIVHSRIRVIRELVQDYLE